MESTVGLKVSYFNYVYKNLRRFFRLEHIFESTVGIEYRTYLKFSDRTTI